MEINTQSNITTAIANSISKLNLNQHKKVQNEEIKQPEIKEEEIAPVIENTKQSKIDIDDIQKYANLMGENLTLDDINYALMYGRSVIADYLA